MQLIELETKIAAPPERCFLLSLSIDLHMASTAPRGERAIAGVTHGIIGPNQTVTWRGRHFGLVLDQTSLFDRYDPPHYFRDVMVKGHFRSFEHEHSSSQRQNGGTNMRDPGSRSATSAGSTGSLKYWFCASTLRDFWRERNSAIQARRRKPIRRVAGISSEHQLAKLNVIFQET